MGFIHASHDCELVEVPDLERGAYEVEECMRCRSRDIKALFGPCPAAQLPDPTDTPLGQEDDWAGAMEAYDA